ncbi:MAG: universal stress protein [Pseudomonadales bacterium]|nr:universal stress protein [Pseudomonadales bacterium]
MRKIKNILVAVAESADTRFVLEKVEALAEASKASVHVVRVIYEGVADLKSRDIEGSVELKSFMLKAAETYLEELCQPFVNRIKKIETATVWNRRTWEGILHAADAVDADLIVKATGGNGRLASTIRTPDDWNLLRHATVPVMLVKEQAWVDNPIVLAALDIFDEAHEKLNIKVLQDASYLSSVLGGELQVICSYPLFEPWVGELGVIRSYEELRRSIETEIIQLVDQICSKADVKFTLLHAEEGHSTHTIAQVAEITQAEILFLGTQAREGVRGVLLGNTSERILHAVSLDVVTVHGSS